jgi:hypothetical protein
MRGSLESIAISATALTSYVRPLDAQGKPQAASYLLMEGKFVGGNAADASERRVRFADLTHSLALSLAKQNYFPSTDMPSTDILIMVHWGTTQIFDDPQKTFNTDAVNTASAAYSAGLAAGQTTDPGDLNAALDQQSAANADTAGVIERNAVLLGYKRSLDKERHKAMSSTDEMTMSLDLAEERYFIVLMACDFQRMKKDHRSSVLWGTRLSVRSPGNNFTEAMPALVTAGADVFGRQLDDLVRVKVPLQPRGQVKLHEMQIWGTVENVPPAKTEK